MLYLLMTRIGLIVLLALACSCAYVPELMLTAESALLNKELSTRLGENISQLINDYTIADMEIS